MIARLLASIVEFSRRNAAVVALAGLVLTFAAGGYSARHLAIDTDLEHLLPSGLAWRQNEITLDQAFPQNNNLLVLVVDGDTAEIADSAARDLTERMRAEPAFFRYVRQPDGGPFFEKSGLLFLSTEELRTISEKLIAAQPLIGTMARDPSLRGLFDTLALFVRGATEMQSSVAQLDPTLTAVAAAVEGALHGRNEPISWQRLMTGRAPEARDLRRFVLTVPVLDFDSLEPGARARVEVQRLAKDLGFDAAQRVRLRMTGPVALNDDQFSTLRDGAAKSTMLSIVLVCAILFMALRSAKLVGAILGTLVAGLVLTAGFAALAIGSLNLISIAFGVLFIGLAVDFGIQFGVRYRDQRHRLGSLPAALRGTAQTIGPALLLAAAATGIGFLSFVPTPYTGIRELGWIAGIGMLIAIVLSFVLLPAGLALLRPSGEPEPVGFRWAAPIDVFLLRRRAWVLAGAGLLAVGSLALLPGLSFDFDPLNLKNPRSQSVVTARDLMNDPMTTPYTAEILAPSLAEAEALAERFGTLPEVAQAITAASFIPSDQSDKLAIIGDLVLLLGPTLMPAAILPPPSDAEALKAIRNCRDALHQAVASEGPQSPTARLAAALDRALARGADILSALQPAVLSGLEQRLAVLRGLVDAKPVTLESLPPELRDGWITRDGRARVEVFPKGDARDPAVLSRFVSAVHAIAPEATGTPVTIQEAGRLISGSFVQAGLIAVAAIILLLGAVLRRLRDVLLVVTPLILAALLTLAIAVAAGMKLNYANIIALPLLLGIGVAFDIYFVMNWRAGESRHLQSSTARAVLFSALTTMSAFGSLAVSQDPGTAEMGEMLTISLACTLFCTLFVLPALLGPAAVRQTTAVRRTPPSASRIGPPEPVRPRATDRHRR